jgi:anthranilate phosphoribosyltransferase
VSQAAEAEQARSFACDILEGRMTDREIAERLQRMRDRGERAEDILGMISAFYPQSKRVRTSHPMVIDLCGTGGAPFRTFNISTTSSFVVAAAGVPVAKHGNRSSIGRCGSADLLEAVGANISPSIETSSRMLDRINFAFLFAPIYHPSMRQASKARRMVPCRTVFNVMGPLMNPVLGRRRQLMGVSAAELLDVVPQVLEALDVEEAMVVHGLPGMDEVSPCGRTQVAHLRNGNVERYELTTEDLGIEPCSPKDIAELSPQAAARCSYEVLRGRKGARRDAVLVNSACAFLVSGKVSSLMSGLALAEMTIDSGKAFAKMREYIKASRGEA